MGGVQAGKLRMRKWVELFGEPRPLLEVLAISELPIGSSKKELCTL